MPMRATMPKNTGIATVCYVPTIITIPAKFRIDRERIVTRPCNIFPRSMGFVPFLHWSNPLLFQSIIRAAPITQSATIP